MTAASTTERLRQHAGLEAAREASSATVFAATCEPIDAQELTEAVSDFIGALDALHHELNARMLRDVGADREARAVDIGWLAVLAGDIDDVGQHIAEEEAARGR